MRFYADLHQKIKDLIDDLEIIPGIPLLDLDHHIIGKYIPKTYIFKMKHLHQILDMFAHIKPQQFRRRPHIDEFAPVSLCQLLFRHVDLQFAYCRISRFR